MTQSRDAGSTLSVLRLTMAQRPLARMRGLLLRPALQEGEGLCLSPCCAIHTVGMRECIDVVFLDAGGQERGRRLRLRPNRIAVCFRARLAVELPAGYCERHPDYLQHIRTALAYVRSSEPVSSR